MARRRSAWTRGERLSVGPAPRWQHWRHGLRSGYAAVILVIATAYGGTSPAAASIPLVPGSEQRCTCHRATA
jgi:hypothetical protein